MLSVTPGATITTIAGNNLAGAGYSGDGILAANAQLSNPSAVATDAVGDVFITDSSNNVIREVNHATGIISTIAGDGSPGYSGDGSAATAAQLNNPAGIAVDAVGDVFIADTGNDVIREVNHYTHQINTVAGIYGSYGYTGDLGQATSAQLSGPQGIAVNAAGTLLYIADTGNNAIREVNLSTGIISTVAGDGSAGFSGDSGAATAAQLDNPTGVTVDAIAEVFIVDEGNDVVRKIDTSGNISTVAGTPGTPGYYGDNGPSTDADLEGLQGIATDAAGDIIVVDTVDSVVREVDHVTGTITTIAGTGSSYYGGDGGLATSAGLSAPLGVAVNYAGDLFIADSGNDVVREVTGLITTVAGNGTLGYSGDGDPAVAAAISPNGVAMDQAGDLFVVDSDSNVVREVNHLTGVITTVAGNGTAGFSGDGGPATAAEMDSPTAVAVDATGNLFIADHYNERIREVNLQTGVITTFAGNGDVGYSGDYGSPLDASFNNPNDVAVDSAGDVFIADTFNNVIREVNHATGEITTVAGDGTNGYSGDDGSATSAELAYPASVAVDANDNLYIADLFNFVIREVTKSDGDIHTVAGDGESGYSGDGGAALDATMMYPTSVAVDSAGDIFIGDDFNNAVREVDVSTHNIYTIAGTGTAGYSGDGGDSLDAELKGPGRITIDPAGNVFIADSSNSAVREVGGVAAIYTAVALTASADSTITGDDVTFTATVTPPYLGGNDLSGAIVNFYDGSTLIDSETLGTSNQVTFTTSDLTLGSHAITANYVGDSYHAPSSSSITETIVNPSSTTLTDSVDGDAVTFTASLDGYGAGTPTGTVEFVDGSTVLGSSPLSSGSAVFTTAYLAAGSHSITAVYGGDSNFIGNTSNTVTLAALPTITPVVSSSTSEAVAGVQTVTLTASVPSTASGNVTFVAGATSLGSATLTNTGTEALLLDGTGGGVTTDLPASSPNMTFSAWVRIDGWTDSNELVNCFDGSGGGFWPGVGYLPNGDWYVQAGGGEWDTGIAAQLANPAVGNGGWHHVTVVFSSSNIQFYYDNLSAVSFGSAGDWGGLAFGNPSSTLTIGYDAYSGGGQYADAAITEVDVWDVGLTSAESAQLYNNGTVLTSGYPESSDLVAGYHLAGDGEDFVAGDAYPGSLFGTYDWTTATPNTSVATLTVNTNSTSPSLSIGVNSITAVYGGETDTFSGGTSPSLPITVVNTTLPSYLADYETNYVVDDVPSQATPSATTDGSLVLPLAVAGLTYVSNSSGQPVVSVDVPISSEDGTLTGVTATLSLSDTTLGETYYSADDLTDSIADGTYRVAVKVSGALPTGTYTFTMHVVETYAEGSPVANDYSVTQSVLNWNSSPFGAGWNLDGLDQLAIDESGNATFVQSDGTMAYFTSNGDGSFNSPTGPFAFMTLTYSDGQYVLKGTYGTEEIFNSSGELHYVYDNDGNVTTYNWSDAVLNSIVDPADNETDFSYTGSQVTTITDFAGRETALAQNLYGQLTSVTLPDPSAEGETQPVFTFGYDSGSGLLTSYIDANGNHSQYAYRPDGTLQTVTSADGSTVTYQAAQSLLFGTGTDGAPGSSTNYAYLVPSTTVRGVMTDEAGSPTLYTFDTFGDSTSTQDALGNTTIDVYNSNALLTETIDPSAINGTTSANPTTAYVYYSGTDELETETAPDGSAQTWTYTSYDTYGGPDEVPLSYVNGLGDETVYSYDSSTADLTNTEQYANGTSADNTGQNTTPGGDPITTTVYTSIVSGGPPAGLVASSTDPDGGVTLNSYDPAGNAIATYQGQTRSHDTTGSSTWTYNGLALNFLRTYDIYVHSSSADSTDYTVAGNEGSGDYYLDPTATTPDAGNLGSGWLFLAAVTVPIGDTSTALSINYVGSGTAPDKTCLLELTSSTVYDAHQDIASQTDAMGNVSAYINDNLDRGVATSQGQTIPFTSTAGVATFNSLPQSPGLQRTYTFYVDADPGDGLGYKVLDNGVVQTLNFSGSSSTPLGSGWYELGTVTLAASDTIASLELNYGDGAPTLATILEQTGTTFYDAMGDVLSHTDGLNRVSMAQYDELEEPVATADGQIVGMNSETSTATFNNLPVSPGQPRTFRIYVNAVPGSLQYSVTENGTAAPSLSTSDAADTPLGNGWYAMGTVILPANDFSTSLTFTSGSSPFPAANGDMPTEVCLVQQDSAVTYTATGLTATATDGDGNVTSYTYNPLGEQIAETDPAPNSAETSAQPVTTDVYDALGRTTSETDPLGHVTAYAYSYGTTYDPTTYSYLHTASVATWQGQTLPQDPSSTGSSQTWTFSNLALSNDIAGASSEQTYEVYVQGTDTALSPNHGWLDTYGSEGLDPSALGSGWTWAGTLSIDSDTYSSLVFSHYGSTTDTNVCLVQLTDTSTYDPNGNLTQETDAAGNTTIYAYNALGLPEQQRVDLSHPWLGPIFDKAGYVVSDTDLQNGYVTEYQYNMLGQQIVTIQPDPTTGDTGLGSVTAFTYDADGQLLSESLPDPANGLQDSGTLTTSYSYDSFGDQVSQTDPLLNTTTSVYDLNGEQIASIDPLGYITTYAFDAFGNQISQRLPDPANGRQDAKSPTTTYIYDTNGNTLSQTDPAGNTTTWTYDGEGNELTQSEVVALGYNADGSVNTTVANYSHQYDLDNNLVQSTDADGQVISYSYDSQNNEVGETWYPTVADAIAGTGADGSDSFSYGVLGNLASASNTIVVGGTSHSVSAYAYQYDSVGNWTAQQIQLASATPDVILTGGYDNNGNQTSLAANIGGTLNTDGTISGGINDFQDTFMFDALGRMYDVTQKSQTTGTYNGIAPKHIVLTYDADSRLTNVDRYQATDTSNLVASSSYGYDGDSRLTSLAYTFPTGSPSTAPAYQWDYDADSRITHQSSTADWSAGYSGDSYSGGATDYIYDATGQLTNATYSNFASAPTSNTSETYDPNGNRTSNSVPETSASDSGAGNRVLFDGTYYYAYDANGNRIAKWIDTNGHPEGSPQPGDTDITVYVWNENSELVSANNYATFSDFETDTTDAAASAIDYAYDPFGRMVTRTDAKTGESESFIYDGHNVALVLNSDGQVMERELYGPAVDQVLATEYPTTGSYGSTQSSGTVLWALPDNQLTVRDMAVYDSSTDTTSVVNHIVYDPSGQITSTTPDGPQPTFTFDGMWQDPTTGLDYAGSGSSWYDAVDGVFASGGPTGGNGGATGGTNPSVFSGNNPIGPGPVGQVPVFLLLPPQQQPRPVDDNNPNNVNNGNVPYDVGGGGVAFPAYGYPPVDLTDGGNSSGTSGYTDFPRIGVQTSGTSGGSGGATKPVRKTPPPAADASPAWAAVTTFFAVIGKEIQALPAAIAQSIEDYFTGKMQTAMGKRAAAAFRNENGRSLNPNNPSDVLWALQFIGQDASGSNKIGEGAYQIDRVTGKTLTPEQALQRFVAGVTQLAVTLWLAAGGAADTADAISHAVEDFFDTTTAFDAADSGTAAQDLTNGCFPPGTIVATSAGDVSIETVKAGDELWAYDLVSSRWRLCKVLRAFVHGHNNLLASITVGGETVEATALHPIWVVRGEDLENRPHRKHHCDVPEGATTPGRWVDACDVHVGDELLLRDGRTAAVEAVGRVPYNGKVYNFAVSELATYAVGRHNILIHNGNARGGEPEEPAPSKPLTAAQKARAENIAKGIPESQLGPSGKPKIHVVEHSSLKEAKDAARAEVGQGGTTVKHPSPEVGDGHFHGVDRDGVKSRIHHEYPE